MKETCKRGHPYTPANTYWGHARGRRYYKCRACDVERKRPVGPAAVREPEPVPEPAPIVTGQSLYRRELAAYLERRAKKLANLRMVG